MSDQNNLLSEPKYFIIQIEWFDIQNKQIPYSNQRVHILNKEDSGFGPRTLPSESDPIVLRTQANETSRNSKRAPPSSLSVSISDQP